MVLGADSRETIEPRGRAMRVEVNIAEKIVKLSRHTAVMMCGDGSQAQYLIYRFLREGDLRDGSATAVAESFNEFCRARAREVRDVPKHEDYFPDYRFIVTGLDKNSRGSFKVPRWYGFGSVSGFRMESGREGFALDGKPMLAYYLFEKHYARADKRTFDPLCQLVGQTLYDTRRIDGDVGGELKMALIRERDGFGWVPEQDVINRYTPDRW